MLKKGSIFTVLLFDMVALVSLLQMIGIAVAVEMGRPCCVECRTTATPMWRGGPTGPRVSALSTDPPLLFCRFLLCRLEIIRALDLGMA